MGVLRLGDEAFSSIWVIAGGAMGLGQFGNGRGFSVSNTLRSKSRIELSREPKLDVSWVRGQTMAGTATVDCRWGGRLQSVSYAEMSSLLNTIRPNALAPTEEPCYIASEHPWNIVQVLGHNNR